MAAPTITVILCAISAELSAAWEEAFLDIPQVRVANRSILEVEADALVSPANSFGYMDGGLDLIYSEHFGWDLEKRVRKVILDEHFGELPVGQAVVVPTGGGLQNWLISSPTMRVPMNVERTANAHLAFRAVLAAAIDHPQISSVACPGLGTGEGRMPPRRCALQMRYAWEAVVEGRLERLGGLAGAVSSHIRLVDGPV